MKKQWILICICMVIAFVLRAQDTVKTTHHKHKRSHITAIKTTNKPNLPEWSAAHGYLGKEHVYFPDYYSFYDPKRGGYVYWQDNRWAFSTSVPPTMIKINLTKTRIQLLKGLSLDLYPELNYPNYIKLYPPAPNGNVSVPAPPPH